MTPEHEVLSVVISIHPGTRQISEVHASHFRGQQLVSKRTLFPRTPKAHALRQRIAQLIHELGQEGGI